MVICEQCGNEFNSFNQCPFCGSKKSFSKKIRSEKMFVVNIKENMPICEEAIKTLSAEVQKAKNRGIQILKIIHGYGSSGKGGELRWCLREYLDSMINRNIILNYLEGENLTTVSTKGNRILNQYPILRKDKDFNRKNRGVTFIIL